MIQISPGIAGFEVTKNNIANNVSGSSNELLITILVIIILVYFIIRMRQKVRAGRKWKGKKRTKKKK